MSVKHRRWEHDEGMDYRVSIEEAVQALSARTDIKPSGHYPHTVFAHPASVVTVCADYLSVEDVHLTYVTGDTYGASMTAELHKTAPRTVAEVIVSFLNHGRPVN